MDLLRVQVAERRGYPVPDEFEVQIFVNDVEMTSAGAGLGMDPYDVLVPVNRFHATTTPTTFGAARCGCGVYGCGSTDVTVVREGDLVHWDWSIEVPMKRRVTFDGSEYDREVARFGQDFSWETPARTAGRLILEGTDRKSLAVFGLRADWVANDSRDDGVKICLALDESHQVFLKFRWDVQTPSQLANSVLKELSAHPSTWQARWHALNRAGSAPIIAGPGWSQVSNIFSE